MILPNVLRQSFVKCANSLSLKLVFSGTPVTSIQVRLKTQSTPGLSYKERAEAEKLGLKNFLKKHRQYAQYNYREWRYPQKQRAIDVSCTREIADPFMVDSPTGMMSLLKSPRSKLVEARNDIFSTRILKKRVPEFHRKRFPEEAQNIYLEVHNLLNTSNWTIVKKPQTEEKLDKLVTEYAYDDMVKGLDTKTVIWKYNETIEPPTVVRVRTPTMIVNRNYYSQVTVRFHSKQTLAIYDRFGRLMMGSTDSPRTVLEYVVFERHISHRYGTWRIHAKIPGNQYREPARRTVAIMKSKPETAAAKAWHEKEEEEHPYKWYPHRYAATRNLAWKHRIPKGAKFWARYRKHRVLNVKLVSKVGMRNKALRYSFIKQAKVEKLRDQGALPPPPSQRDG